MAVPYSRNDKLVARKFYHYLVPTILMVLAMQFGSLADSIVVGNFLGDAALSAASLGLPVVFLVELPGFTIAVGAGILGANFIGKRQIKDASQTFKAALLLGFALSAVFIPLGIFVSGPLSQWLAGNFGELSPMIAQYIQAYFFQAPVLALGLVVAYFLPADNSPVLGAIYFFIANLVHIGAEILFVVFLPKDVAMYGVGFSMGIGMAAGLLVLIPYFLSKKRTIDLKIPFKGALRQTWPMLKSGATSSAFIALMMVFCLVVNFGATSALTPNELPIFAMLSNFAFVADLFLLGIYQVMPSIIPALHGEKDYFSIRGVVKRVILIGMAVAVALTAVSLLFPELFFYIFGVDLESLKQAYLVEKPHGIADPLFIIRVYVLSFLLYSLNKFFVNYYPAVMVNSPGVVSHLFRSGLVGPVTIFFLLQGLGVIGYSLGSLIMEGAALLATGAYVLIANKAGKLPGKGLLLLPKGQEGETKLDISIPGRRGEISEVSRQIQEFAVSASGDEKAAAMLALACEEIIANVIEYGYERSTAVHYIDVRVTLFESHLMVRIRDDGVAFDPTAHAQNEGNMEYHGIEVVRKVASSFTHLRVLSTNNTIMEIPLYPKETVNGNC